MADLRLVGRQLAAVRSLAENPISRQALWKVVSRDFGVAELDALPARDRGIVELMPRPVQGAPPRTFGEPIDPPPVASGSGAELRAAYAAGEATPREVCDRMFARLDARDFGPSTFSPYVALDREGALAAADASTERYREGRPLGVLDGIPVPVKDQFHMRGLPTRGGTAWRDATIDEDAVIVTRLREGGAVLPGKAHTVESGLNPLGYNPHFAEYPRNVYSDRHGAGGSSTGSAVAVGLGLAPTSVSTDGGGSIRIPAAVNGLFGLKPSFLRLPRGGDIWSGSVGHTGPIGMSTHDLVDLMEVTAGRYEGDPLTHFAADWDTVIPTWRQAMGRSLKGCRIAVLRDELADAEPAIARACEEALKAAEAEGAILSDLTIPLLPIANAIGPLVIAGEGMCNMSDDIAAHRAETGDELRMIHGLMQCVTAQQHLQALRTRTRLRQVMAEAIAAYDLLALPAHARLAAPYPLSESGVQVADTAWTASMTRFNFMGNLTGLPACSIPVGMSAGLPIGLQLVGDAWDEASVIAACAAFERMEVTKLPRSAGFRSLLA